MSPQGILSLIISVAIGSTMFVVAGACAEMRQWTSLDGKFKVTAEVDSVVDSKVRLRTDKGRSVVVRIGHLSDADREFLKSFADTTGAAEPSGVMSDQQATEGLQAKGVRVLNSGLALADETTLSKSLRLSDQLRHKLQTASRSLSKLEKDSYVLKEQVNRLRRANVQMSAQLATVNAGGGGVRLNNKLVGALKANEGQMELLKDRREEVETQIKQSRASLNQEVEKFSGQLLAIRKQADSIRDRYDELAADTAVKEAVALLNQDAKQTLEVTPSRGFKAMQRRLKAMEDMVLTENIPLEVTPGGTMYVSVVINGEHQQQMVLDSGASVISLPGSIAAKCGIEVDSSAPRIQLTLADNSVISGRLVTIAQVRVGKFIVENVECAVLGPEAINAPPLLGMSFLGNFKFEVDANDQSLRMIEVASDAR